MANNREFKNHICSKRQTADSSWEFLKIENKQIKTAQSNNIIVVEIMYSKWQKGPYSAQLFPWEQWQL